jgi:hypothetical protein
MGIRRAALFLAVGLCLPVLAQTNHTGTRIPPPLTVRRVLLISIDGIHPGDVANLIRSFPDSTLAHLSATGITYSQAFTSKPSDSFPGLLSMVTGGSPASTGVWYEGSYARWLSPPGSQCKVIGTKVVWDFSIDKNSDAIDGGGGIDPAKLPLDPGRGCVPVFPHDYLKVNTIFEVIHSAGMRTAWVDKHPSYEMVSGRSGQGLDDLFTPEIYSTHSAKVLSKAEAYDDIKVRAVINEINGMEHTGTKMVGVPAMMGLTFQAVSDAERLEDGGHTDAGGKLSPVLLESIRHVDQSIGEIVNALRTRDLSDSTLIIISAKHVESPIDRNKWHIIGDEIIPNIITKIDPGSLAFAYQDGTLASFWLKDQSQTGKVIENLSQPMNQTAGDIQHILTGHDLALRFGESHDDQRFPDIVVIPNYGGMFAPEGDSTRGGHGGFSDEDTHVMLLVSNPRMRARTISALVQTTQIAATIVRALGLDPNALEAVRQESTEVLPAIFAERRVSTRSLSSQ